MKFKELLRMVFVNIWAYKFRAFLTTLGIIVGAATIILVVAVGKGGQASVSEQFAKLSVGTIFVMPSTSQGYKVPLSVKDVAAIKEETSSVATASITINSKATASFNDINSQPTVLGAFPDIQKLYNLKLNQGKFIIDEDDASRNRVAVLGADLAEELFGAGARQSVGAIIYINRKSFEVIGVLNRMGDSSGGISIDSSALMPYTVAEKYILGPDAQPRITVLAKDLNSVLPAIDEITTILRNTHKIRGLDDFIIRDAGSRLAAAQSTTQTMSVLLIIVAAIVLIVGGIGIMNVMYVSVKERTREIGILKAIGAKRKEILLQFLLEGIIISFIGGIIGACLGIAITPLTQYMLLKAIPSASGVMLSLVFSMATGTFFGYYPALKAAGLSPMEALRYE